MSHTGDKMADEPHEQLEQRVHTLIDMGFSPECARRAAMNRETTESAVDALLAESSLLSDAGEVPTVSSKRVFAAEMLTANLPRASTEMGDNGRPHRRVRRKTSQHDLATHETLRVNEDASVRCAICVEDLEVGRAVRLPCGHGWYCPTCVQRHTEARLASGSHEVPCPECGQTVAEALLRIILPHRTMEQLLARSLERAVGSSDDLCPCPTPDCPNRVALERGMTPRLDCPLCKREHCLRCHASPYHTDFTCAEHAELQSERDDGFKHWMESTGTKQCPRCQMAVSKEVIEKQGTQSVECHKMICRNCSCKFCFKCLALLTSSFTCGCTPDSHGFINPRTGQFNSHLTPKRGRR